MTHASGSRGEIELIVRPVAELTPDDAKELTSRWEAWVRALELGMFPPGGLPGRLPAREGGGPRIVAEGVPRSAFRVLAGMLAHFSEVGAPLASYSVRDSRTGAELLNDDAPFPPAPGGELAARLDLDPERVGQDITIAIEFARPMNAGEREQIATMLECWTKLLDGGYPFEGQLPGQSAFAGSVRFLEPSTAAVEAEFILAAPECMTPLLHMVESWKGRWPVSAVRVEGGYQ